MDPSDLVALSVTLLGGILGGAGLAVGIIEASTGRMVLKFSGWGNLSEGEVRARGLGLGLSGLLVAIYGFAAGVAYASNPNWVPPIWWGYIESAGVLLSMALVVTSILIYQHHNNRWPFNRRRNGQSGQGAHGIQRLHIQGHVDHPITRVGALPEPIAGEESCTVSLLTSTQASLSAETSNQ